MRKLWKVGIVWTVAGWLATTWVGAVMGFLFVWTAIIIFAGIAAAVGASAQTSLPDPRPILYALWGVLLAIALIRMALAWRKQDLRRAERSGTLAISLIGLFAVVYLSLETMKGSWP